MSASNDAPRRLTVADIAKRYTDGGRLPAGEDRDQPGGAALDLLDVGDVGRLQPELRPAGGGVVDLDRDHRPSCAAGLHRSCRNQHSQSRFRGA